MVLTIKCRELKTADEKDWPYDEVAFAHDLLKAWGWNKDEDEIPNHQIWSGMLIYGHFQTKIHGPNWLSIRMGAPQKPHLFFYYRSTPELAFEPVFAKQGQGIKIEHEEERILVNFEGEKTIIDASPACEGLWPWVLLDIDEIRAKLLRLKIVSEKLHFLVEEKKETNPLTILIRSPQPYRGLGFQISERISEALRLL